MLSEFPPASTAVPNLLAALDAKSELLIARILLQLVVIIMMSRLLAMIARQLGQPAVVGEIIGGLMLGPSFLGRFFPEVFNVVFDPGLNQIFTAISQLGLIFLLFLVGLEFDFSHLKARGMAAWSISLTGILLPMSTGYALGWYMHDLLGLTEHHVAFCLFMGTAMSITAIPILGRIMSELNLTRTSVGVITITAAAVDDAMGWILLATVTALVQAEFNLVNTLRMAGLTIAFALLMVYVVGPLMRSGLRAAIAKTDGSPGFNTLAAVFIVLFLCSIATAYIGIFAIFGAFILGAVLSPELEFKRWISQNLTQFVTVFFLPVFFTFTGLRTDIGTLDSAAQWLMAAAVSTVAIFGKFGGCSIAARVSGFSGREAACIGVMMNTRALMELIVINAGYNLGVLPKSVYAMLVMMAVLTTIMTTPLLVWLSRGTELRALIDASEIGRRRRRAAPT